MFDPKEMESLGFVYKSIGRPASDGRPPTATIGAPHSISGGLPERAAAIVR
jgi:hypothetical protein